MLVWNRVWFLRELRQCVNIFAHSLWILKNLLVGVPVPAMIYDELLTIPWSQNGYGF